MIFQNNHNNGVIYMSVLKDENYINIQGWMVTKLGLKGNALLIYAIIYGFSQDGESMYTGTQGYLADWTSSSKETIRKTLNTLVEQNYIIRVIDDVNNIQFYKKIGEGPKNLGGVPKKIGVIIIKYIIKYIIK